MSATDDDDDDEQQPPTLAEAFEALAGRGWVAVGIAGGEETTGFEFGPYRVTRHFMNPDGWTKVGSWTTGAGRGWHHYRGETAGHTVEWVDTSRWPESYGDAYLVVHDEDGRGADQHGWREGSPPDADRALRSDD